MRCRSDIDLLLRSWMPDLSGLGAPPNTQWKELLPLYVSIQVPIFGSLGLVGGDGTYFAGDWNPCFGVVVVIQ